MNIFHNKLWISFLKKGEFPQFAFETQLLAKLKEKLLEKGPDFPAQVFYLDGENTKKFCEDFLALIKNPKIGRMNFRVNLYFESEKDIDEFVWRFKSYFSPIVAAGGIPVAPDGDFLLIYRHRLWDLAKGKLDEGEQIDSCAWREVMEETGLQSHAIGNPLKCTYHIFLGRNARTWRFKTTYWYLMPCAEKEETYPQIEEGITEVRWVPQADLRHEMPDTYPLIQEVLREALYG